MLFSLVVVFPFAAFAQRDVIDLTATFSKQGAVIDKLEVYQISDILLIRGKTAGLTAINVAGVGNIYADEALWRAKVHPLTPANELSPDEVKAVHKGVRESLRAGVRRQGSTLRDYQLPDGSSGRAQERFKVYGRAGRPCERCGTPIDKIRAAGRGTWYCPSCQVLRSGGGYAATSSSSRPSRSRRQSSV